MEYISTRTLDAWFSDLRSELRGITDRYEDIIANKNSSSKCSKIFEALIVTLQREAGLLPPGKMEVAPDQLSQFWSRRYNAFYMRKNRKSALDKLSRKVSGEIHDVWTWLWNLEHHFKQFTDWILGDRFQASVHGDPPPNATTGAGAKAAWYGQTRQGNYAGQGYWGPYTRTHRDNSIKHLDALLDALKELVGKALDPVFQDTPGATREMQKLLAADMGHELKKGEKLGLAAPVPRGGNVAGFIVTNEVGLSKALYNSAAKLLVSVRQILSRKGLDPATQNVPILYMGKSKSPRKGVMKDTGAEFDAAGWYFHERGKVVGLVFDDDNVLDVTVQDSESSLPWHLVGTILHEIGHYYYYNRLSSAARSHHKALYSKASTYPSSYAKQDAGEDFAELWTAYLGRQYYRDGHSGYSLTNECWHRFKSTIALDPRLKEISKMVAEAQTEDWSADLHEFCGKSSPEHVVEGEKHHLCKLTDRQVVEIRVRALRGHRQEELAEEYGVSQGLISQIVNRKVRKHATPDVVILGGEST